MTVLSRICTFGAAALVFSLVGCGGDNPVGASDGRQNVGGGGTRPTHQEAERKSYLLTLGDKYLSFHSAHGRSPATTQEFVAHVVKGKTDEILKVALAKLQSGNIEMIWNGKLILNGGRPYVWGYEKQTELASGYVLMSDHSVIRATREEFAELERLPQAP